ncbi:MAG: hypothetical protein GY829_03935, partial [Gammaproteobacteria bacterium]|nr:hypothetical protein [Gammaproteobacteria bacterium]
SETSAALDADRAETAAEAIEAFQCAMTKSEFFALAEKRIRDNAGSGLLEWGKNISTLNTYVNDGLWVGNEGVWAKDAIFLGKEGSANVTGISRVDEPVYNVNGITLAMSQYSRESTQSNRSVARLPPAPDGTKTYDTATGNVVQHADSATAFASEGATNKVILSRQDFVFLEVWHEKLVNACPLGCAMFQEATYKGISLNARSDGYTRYGEWDTTTIGRYAVWDNLSFAEKDIFLSDPDNNIYKDGDDLIQVCWRIRVIEGLGDDWQNISPNGFTGQLAYEGVNAAIKIQCSETAPDTGVDLGLSNDGRGFYGSASPHDGAGLGHGIMHNIIPDAPAHNNLGFAVPIALVQRRNQGAYHPEYNKHGCGRFKKLSGNTSHRAWHEEDVGNIVSTEQCLTPRAVGDNNIGYANWSGNIGSTAGSGRTNDGKFYDAIYASDVKDLRMSSRRRPKAEIREEAFFKAKAGKVRGFEGVPFTQVRLDTSCLQSTPNNRIDLGDVDNLVNGKKYYIYNPTVDYVGVGTYVLSA